MLRLPPLPLQQDVADLPRARHPEGVADGDEPPFTLAFAGSILSSRIAYSGTHAKASLISQRSMSSTDKPERLSSLGTAWTGPIPISSGAQPATA